MSVAAIASPSRTLLAGETEEALGTFLAEGPGKAGEADAGTIGTDPSQAGSAVVTRVGREPAEETGAIIETLAAGAAIVGQTGTIPADTAAAILSAFLATADRVALAGPGQTCPVSRTGAGYAVLPGHVLATGIGFAAVHGAGIGIVARQRLPQAPSSLADILVSAQIGIVAELGVGHELTAGGGIAVVGGAGVGIVAHQAAGPHALPQVAEVIDGAEIFIRAGSVVEHGEASLDRVADISGADVAVIAVEGADAQALTSLADITHRALIAVITVAGHGLVKTAEPGNAEVLGAGFPVVAVQRHPRLTQTVKAPIAQRAPVSIFTLTLVGVVDAARRRHTSVVGARVAVVAVHHPTSRT